MEEAWRARGWHCLLCGFPGAASATSHGDSDGLKLSYAQRCSAGLGRPQAPPCLDFSSNPTCLGVGMTGSSRGTSIPAPGSLEGLARPEGAKLGREMRNGRRSNSMLCFLGVKSVGMLELEFRLGFAQGSAAKEESKGTGVSFQHILGFSLIPWQRNSNPVLLLGRNISFPSPLTIILQIGDKPSDSRRLVGVGRGSDLPGNGSSSCLQQPVAILISMENSPSLPSSAGVFLVSQ